ncbi:hypothetical protein PsorP6_000553 [Peronosclerospora sorghi]|uniref:Uncharacterized protein n=1 Tax=Peronosclerospora sorghi TaxID=230839 RepID=A0ACC0WU42_9STRA|nr:hypothetical protein PsorP6_000553 [Peronosclerospora sorghi]
MTSLGSAAQSSLWTKSLEHFRYFKTIRNAGISFKCTDRDVCMKLGEELRPFVGASLKSNLFPNTPTSTTWTQRLLDDATDGIIYDWFVDHSTRPVYITPARVIGGLRSHSRRVYFYQKTPPKCVMVDSLVHHRINAYNQHVPPFIKENKERQSAAKKIKDKKTAAKESKDKKNSANKDKKNVTKESKYKQFSAKKVSPNDNADMNSSDDDKASPACNDDRVISDNVAMASESDSDKSDSGETNTLDEVRDVDEEPTFPVDPIRSDDCAPTRICRDIRMVFGTIADPQVDLQPLPPSQK